LGIISLIRHGEIRGSLVEMFIAAYRPLAWFEWLKLMDGKFFREMGRRELLNELVAARAKVTFDFEDSNNFKLLIGSRLVAASGGARVGVKSSLVSEAEVVVGLSELLIDRLKVQQREAGVRHDLIDAVFALGGEDDLVRLLARVHALQAFVTTEDGTNLLAGYKRAANILKKENYPPRDGEGDRPQGGGGDSATSAGIGGKSPPSAAAPLPPPPIGEGAALTYKPEPAEKALIDALDAAAPRASQAVEDERFADAMAALASLRAPIDQFFEEVTVNDTDANKRAARLALLARFRDAVHRVADFSRIEG
ncbi:MAG: glycine--tRNA ligase subunit beta, partial [Alphaproteobacteria bacterium]|nr:glycine--tRNA ligase subunit beta [Alphaproteobacteria bacterium]